MTGFFSMFKKRRMTKRRRIRENAETGQEAEDQFRNQEEMKGHDVKRTGKGHDFYVSKRNWLTGKKTGYYAEVKSSETASVSPLQKKMKKRYGSRYKVVRVDPDPYKIDMGGLDSFGTEKPKRRHKSEDSTFGMDFFGTDKPKRRRKGSSDNFFDF